MAADVIPPQTNFLWHKKNSNAPLPQIKKYITIRKYINTLILLLFWTENKDPIGSKVGYFSFEP